MSGAQEYYDSLMAQGYTPEQAKGFTQQHFPGFSPAVAMPAPMPAVSMPAPMPAAPQMGMPMGAPMGGMMPAPSDRPGVLNWVALGLTAAAIAMVFIAMFSNSWMTGEEEDFVVYLKNHTPNNHNGAMKNVQRLKKIFSFCRHRSLSSNNPFEHYRIKFKPYVRGYLSLDQLFKIVL